MGGRWARLALAASLACLGCGSESLGGQAPTGSGGTTGSGGMAGAAGDLGTLGPGGGGASGSAGVAQFCGQITSATDVPIPPDFLVLLDRSSSMNDDVNEVSCPGGCGPSSKWAVLGGALDQLVNTNRVGNWGIAYYPTDDSCGVGTGAAVDVGPNEGLVIERSLGTTTVSTSGAPTGAAISAAVAYLQSLADDHAQYIVLATDGHSGCASGANDTADGDAITAAAAALAVNIPIFVVGVVPASDTAAILALNQLAASGGEPVSGRTNAFYTMADLVPPFPGIGPASSCAISLPHPIGSAILEVELVANDGQLTHVPDDPTDGWSRLPPGSLSTGDGILLTGSYCAGPSAGPSNVQISYLCPL